MCIRQKIITVQLLLHHRVALLAAVIDKTTMLRNIQLIIRTLLALLAGLLRWTRMSLWLVTWCGQKKIGGAKGLSNYKVRQCLDPPLATMVVCFFSSGSYMSHNRWEPTFVPDIRLMTSCELICSSVFGHVGIPSWSCCIFVSKSV